MVTKSLLLSCAMLHCSMAIAQAGVTTTLPQPTTTTSTTTTSLVFPDTPACGDMIDDDRITATDALGVLQAAVGTRLCGRCVCDVDGSGAIVASDALIVLRVAVGQAIPLMCPIGGDTVAWDGGGDGTLWEDAANWAGDRLPDLCDIAQIDSPAIPAFVAGGQAELVVNHNSGTHGVLGVVSMAELVLGGGSLTVTGPVYVTNRFAVVNATLATARIANAPGGSVEVTGRPTFDAVTLDTFVEATVSSVQITVLNGLTVNEVLRFAAQNAGILVAGSGEQLVGGSGEVQVLGGGVAGFLFARDADTVLRIGPDLLVSGSGGGIGGSGALIIDGTIAPSGGFGLTISSDDWTNNGALTTSSFPLTISGTGTNAGTIDAINGGTATIGGEWLNLGEVTAVDSTLNLGTGTTTPWDNDGVISVENSVVDLRGAISLDTLGIFERMGGTVRLTGSLDNAVGLVLDDDRGDWIVSGGGSIVGGTVSATAGHELNVQVGTLDGVTLDTPVAITANGSRATFINGTTLNGSAVIGTNSLLSVNGTGAQVLAGTGEIELLHSGLPGSVTSAAPMLTIGPGIRIFGATGGVGLSAGSLTLVNQGTIEATAGGNPIAVAAATGINEGMMIADANSLWLSGGWTNTANMVAKPGKLLRSSGDLALDSAGTLEVQIASTVSVGHLQGLANVTLGGTLVVTLTDGFEPNIGNTFRVLDWATTSGAFDTVQGLDIGNGKVFQQNYDATGLTLEVVAQ